MKLTRSAPLLFDRHDGTTIIAQPVTRGQMREVFEIDRASAEAESPSPAGDRRGAQVAIFLRRAKWVKMEGAKVKKVMGKVDEVLPDLSTMEEIQIIHAFTAQHHGFDIQTAVGLQAAYAEILKKKPVIDPQPRLSKCTTSKASSLRSSGASPRRKSIKCPTSTR